MLKEQLAPNIIKLTLQERQIILLGTAHIFEDSVNQVKEWIENYQPDSVYVELCEARYQALSSHDRWKNLDIIQVIKSGQGFLLLASLLLSGLQKKMGIQLDEEVGEDMLSAIRLSQEKNIPFILADRDLNTTLRRTWQLASFKDKMRILEILFESLFEDETISEEDIKNMLGEGNLYTTMMNELGKSLPAVKRVLIDERNHYIAQKILSGPGKRCLVVIGRGHLEGIVEALEEPSRLPPLETLDNLPQKTSPGHWIGWGILVLFLGLVITGFFKGGSTVALSMIKEWIIINGTGAALGCLLALAHPVTILSSWIIAPITSLNPFVGAGMFLALIETFFHKPRVKDFENLPQDITSFKGFWNNRVTKILLVFVTGSLGSAIGTFVSIPWMSRLLK
ncbi:TraB/GumN family protein [Thermospira aquatica]|uniref:TraB/GumN family protein n=1 Tax=Thermospira aquatica TaxID=2828656 RepID=A0AAX3BD54_9SPIR|nr:TraB/GumN family protein [Thermospira aquatica]URA10232.1 TraB/GumN family protein [Thermospira aquatica]